MDYVWARRSDNYRCMDFYGVHDDEDDHMLVDGESMVGQTFNGGLRSEAQAYSKKKLEDFARSQAHIMLVSQKARDVIEAFAPGGIPMVEWLPLSLVSSSGKPVTKKSYSVLHPIEHIDALDPNASGATFNPISPTCVNHVERLVMDASKIPADRHIFRLQKYTAPIFFSRPLAEHIQAADLSGILFGEIEELDRYELF